jgi:hypothetical protein
MRFLTAAVILATALTAMPALAAAQEPVRDFNELNTRLKPGDTIWITDAQGREVKGKIVDVAPGVLTLKADRSKAYTSGDVNLIRTRRPDSLGSGALIGFAAGSSVGIACYIDTAGESEMAGWCTGYLLVFGALGAGLGVGIDALIPGRKTVVFRAPGSTGAASARLTIAPIVTPRAKGVAVGLRF